MIDMWKQQYSWKDSYMDGREYVLEKFLDAYESTKEMPRALYGIGDNTRKILGNISDYNIVALMDKENEGEKIYGYPILKETEIIGRVSEIVVIARFSVLKIIYKRISWLEKKGIIIKTFDGEQITELFFSEENETCAHNRNLEYQSETELKKMISEANVVSFDVFGTLINRQVLRPEHIFDFVELELKKVDIKIHFKTLRLEAESTAKKIYGNYTNIDNIYEVLKNNTRLGNEVIKKIKEIEIETEKKYIVPRKKVIEYYNIAREKNKKIYLLSDMYLQSEIIEGILKAFKIDGYTECIVSCEYGASKADKTLFEVLKDKCQDNNILHIGDDYENDIQQGLKADIKVFYLMNYYDMLLNSVLIDLLSNVKNSMDSWMMGIVFSKTFDNPFYLIQNQGKLKIKNVEELVNICFLPLLLKFMCWCCSLLKGREETTILFAARDGFLIDKIYTRIREREGGKNFPENRYFLASRRGLIVPNIRSEKEILAVVKEKLNQVCSDENSRMIIERLGVFCEPDSTLMVKEFLLQNKNLILENAKDEQQLYKEYIKKLKLKNEIILFDLVTAGTLPTNLKKIMGKEISTICFATMEIDKKDKKKYDSLFGNGYFYDYGNFFFLKAYCLWEEILSSNEGQFIRFLAKCQPKYRVEESKTKLFLEMQELLENMTISILEHVSIEFVNEINIFLVDNLFECITSKYSVLDNSLKEIFEHYDPYDDKNQNLWNAVSMIFLEDED